MSSSTFDISQPTIFCFTYAGGTGAFFDLIEKDMPSVNLVKLEYAGHGSRHREKVYNNFDALADDMFLRIQSQITENYALLGYSMGSIAAVEVLRRIIDTKLPLPRHIFLAAHEPHAKSELSGFTLDERDAWVKQRTIEFGDIPKQLIDNQVFWKMYLPLYRADYKLIGEYDFNGLRLHTTIPASIFYSESDTPIKEMKLWEKYFENCEYHCYVGNHFFIREYHREIADIIMNRLV